MSGGRARTGAFAVLLVAAVLPARPAAAQPEGTVAAPAYAWQAIGPNAQGGKMLTFPDDPRRMLVTSQNSRLFFETRDAGVTWQARDVIPVGDGKLVDLVADPADQRRIWAVMRSDGRDPSYRGKLFVSGDSGVTWRLLPAPDRDYRHLAVHHSGQILVATSFGGGGASPAAYLSRDGGMTWTELLSSSSVGPSAMLGDTLYLSTMEGIVRILDVRDPASRGEIVFAADGGSFAWMRGVTADAGIVVADTMFRGVWASTDQGATWAEIRPFRLGTSMVKAAGGEIMVGYGTEFHISGDAGATWTVIPNPWSTTFAIDAVRWDADGSADLYLASTGAGIVRLRADGTERIGVPAAQSFAIATVALPGQAPVLAVGTARDVYRTTLPTGGVPPSFEWGDSGAEGLVGRAAIKLAGGRGVLYKVIEDHLGETSVHRSDDAGATWQAVTAPSSAFVHALTSHPADPAMVAVSASDVDGNAVRVSTDFGRSWRTVWFDQPVADLAADPADPAVWYAAGAGGVWLSKDAGATFTKLSDQPGDHLAVAAGESGRLVLSHAGRLFTSSTGGRTWEEAAGVGTEVWVSDLAFSPVDPDLVVAGASAWYQNGQPRSGAGVLRSDDGGRTWRLYDQELAVRDVRAIAFHPDGRSLYAVTMFGGVYHAPM